MDRLHVSVTTRSGRRAAKRITKLAQRTKQLELLSPQETPMRRLCRRTLRTLEWIFGPPLAGVGIVYAVYGPIWPTVPVFLPGLPSYGSPFEVPFSITNKSVLFTIHNLTVDCDLIYVETSAHSSYSNFSVSMNIKHRLLPTRTDTYTCPFNTFFDTRGQTIETAVISFTTVYDSPWPWGGRTGLTSGNFTLKSSTTPPQWTVGNPIQ